MSPAKHYQTAARDHVPSLHNVIYGSGAFANNLLAYAIGSMVIVLNLGLDINRSARGPASINGCANRSAHGLHF